jgi:hypothetical protein
MESPFPRNGLMSFVFILKWNLVTKVIKTPNWMDWVQRPSSLIKVEESTNAF